MSSAPEETKALFRKAVARASRAPSIHNTQPWHFVVRPDVLELRGESDRQLKALDPTGRQMVISCGCALFNARVGLVTDRVVQVDRLPNPAEPDLLARLTVLDEPAPWTPLVRLDPMIEKRHTNRRDFFDEDVPPDVIYELTTAAEQEEASLVEIRKPEHKVIASNCLGRPRPFRTSTRAIKPSCRLGQLLTSAGQTAFRSLPFRVPIPVSSLRAYSRLRCFGEGMAAEAEAVQPQSLPDGAGDGEIYSLGVVASRRGAAAHFVGSHPVELCSQPRQPGGRGALHPGPPSQRAWSGVSSTSLDEDRPSSSNARLSATRSDRDHFGDRRLT